MQMVKPKSVQSGTLELRTVQTELIRKVIELLLCVESKPLPRVWEECCHRHGGLRSGSFQGPGKEGGIRDDMCCLEHFPFLFHHRQPLSDSRELFLVASSSGELTG